MCLSVPDTQLVCGLILSENQSRAILVVPWGLHIPPVVETN